MTKELEAFISDYEKEMQKVKTIVDAREQEKDLKREVWVSAWKTICKDIIELAEVIKKMNLSSNGFKTGITTLWNDNETGEVMIIISKENSQFTIYKELDPEFSSGFCLFLQVELTGRTFFCDEDAPDIPANENDILYQMVMNWDTVSKIIEEDIMHYAKIELEQKKKEVGLNVDEKA